MYWLAPAGSATRKSGTEFRTPQVIRHIIWIFWYLQNRHVKGLHGEDAANPYVANNPFVVAVNKPISKRPFEILERYVPFIVNTPVTVFVLR